MSLYYDIVTPVLSIQDATKTYDTTPALKGASLEMEKGQWLGLLGPNGAGKTTLVRAIAGRVRLDAGSITLFGELLNGATSKARARLGIVPQEIAIYPLLTARENLHVFGKLNGVRGSVLRNRIDWALGWTGLDDRARERVNHYSGGMKRRLNIACAILHEPEVLLLDEPTVGVDPQSRQRIWEMLGELKEGGTSILLTTHALEEAQQVCEKIVIIDHGRDIAAGTFHELLKQTVGSQRRVRVIIEGRETIERTINDVATDLHALLDELKRDKVVVNDLQIEVPTLQAVFLHLTGRELRE